MIEFSVRMITKYEYSQMKPAKILLFLFIISLITTCKKDPDDHSGTNKFEYEQISIDSVSYFQAVLKTTIAELGGNEILEYGHCWSTSSNPNLSDSTTSFPGEPAGQAYQSHLADLVPNTKYYAKAYCKLSNTTVFSDEIEFTTLKTGLPVVLTLNVSEVTLFTARCDGQVVNDSGLVITQRGVIWDTIESFNYNDNLGKIIGGTGTGQFSCQLTQLLEGKTYFIKAYAVNAAGTAYGEVKSFETIPLQLPEVTTDEITQITTSSAKSGGNVTSSGNGTVSARGVCWGTEPSPTLEDCSGFTSDGSGTGSFTSNISGLSDGIIYYVTAYATNERGTAYGNQQSFQTVSINLPTVITSAVTSITTTSAQSGGNVTSSGNGSVSARGVCYGTDASITLDNCLGFTTNGSGTGSYTSSITGLTPGNTYYVRAYATNENGTGYGSTLSFNTPDVPSVSTAEVINITANSAQSGGTVTHNGFGTVSGRGICWGVNPNPSLGDCIGFTNNGSGMGSYTAIMNDLDASTMYYVRAYATNETGTGYGDLKSFVTSPIGLPVVKTNNITDFTTTSVKVSGEVTEAGYGTVTAKGVCWGIDPNPSIDENLGYTNEGAGIGTFISDVTGLTPGTLYYVRAYATNETGTAYGELKSFTTLAIGAPSVTTAIITNITISTAQGGGEVTDAGNGTVTARGVCWNTTGNPSLGSCLGFTTDGSGLGIFTSSITGLTDGTTYYVKAYATNQSGTGYGDDRSFITTAIVLPLVTTSTVTNITMNSAQSGGNVIDAGNGTVTARGVCWNTTGNPTLGNNLGYTTNGSGIGVFISYLNGLSPGTFYYVAAYATNQEGTAYGNIETFTSSSISLPGVTTDSVTNIANTSANCWGTVTDAGNGTVSVRGICWNTTGSPTLENNLGYTQNGSGLGPFMGQMTGLTQGTLYYVAAYATNEAGTSYGTSLSFTTTEIVLPFVTTDSVINITYNSAQAWGNVVSSGNGSVSARGFCWNTTGNPTLTNNIGFTITGSGNGIFYDEIVGLEQLITYYLVAYSTNEAGTTYGDEIGFSTPASEICGIMIVDYEGKIYHTVQIGDQCWLKENLDVGIMIPGTQDQQNNGIIEKYCYNNLASNCSEYGGLYQWYEMMEYTTQQGAQGICPSGWHIPANWEFITLSTFLGGDEIAGGKLKEAGYVHWNYPNSGATNSSGFTALPSGSRYTGGDFLFIGSYNQIWASNEYISATGYYRQLSSNNQQFQNYHENKTNGYSIRCIKDN